MKLKPFLIFIALCLSFSPSHANDITDDFDDYIRQQMAEQNIAAFSALLFTEDEIIHQVNFGHSNLKIKRALTENDVFLMASVSKMVTATALLQLIDQGKFNLDDKINNYLPFKVNIPHQNQPITFRMLLTHTAAIADGDSLDGQYYHGKDSPVTLLYFLENYFTPNGEFYDAEQNFHNHPPGSQFEYSNIGSALIGLLVEQVSGQDFAAYTQNNIFKPLGMNNTNWRLNKIRNTIVTLYEDGRAIQNYTFTDYPNGGLRSTALDMQKFIFMIGNYGRGTQADILTQKITAQMLTPQIPNIDNSVGLQIYFRDKQSQMWGHDGGEQGTTTYVGINPNNGFGVILLINSSDADLEGIIEYAYETAVDQYNFSSYD